MKFRHLEDLRDKHKGEEIWILGRGPSLDDFPKGFFEGKITITLNWAFLAHPNSTYYFSYHPKTPIWVAKNWPKKFNRCILGCKYGREPRDKQSRNKWHGSGVVPIYAKVKWGTGLNPGRFKVAVENNIAKRSSILINSMTTLHTGIQVALVLGAKKITLAGCDLKIARGLLHAKSTWLSAPYERKTYKKRVGWHNKKFFPNSRRGLQWLVDICKPYGIDIVRYYYRRGYEEIKA